MDDQILIKKIQNGEVDCFSFLVKKYLPLLQLFFSQRLKEKEDQEDLIQETFFNFYKNIERFDVRKPIKPYLLTIASNQLKMFWRKKRATVNLSENIIDERDILKEDRFYIDTSLNPKEKKIIILATSNLFFSSVVKLKSFDFFNLFCEDFEVVSRYFFESFYAFSLEIPKEYLLIIFMTLIFFTFVLLTIFKNYYKTKNKIRSILKFLQTKI